MKQKLFGITQKVVRPHIMLFPALGRKIHPIHIPLQVKKLGRD